MRSDSLPGIMFTAVGLIVLIAEVYNIRRLTTKKRRCTMRVQGQVVDYYPDALPLPIVEYTVNGVCIVSEVQNSRCLRTTDEGEGAIHRMVRIHWTYSLAVRLV